MVPHLVWGWEGANSSKGSLCRQREVPAPLPTMGAHCCHLEPASPSPGTRHFLLFCGVRPEDKGLVRFAARTVISEASLQVEGTSVGCEVWLDSQHQGWGVPGWLAVSLWKPTHPMMLTPGPHPPALPIRIVKPLRDKTVLARHKATLECTVSHARGRVRWLRGDTEIFAGDKYEICNLDCYRTLIIHRVSPEDEDSYTCDAFDDRSTARLLVEGEWALGGAPLPVLLCLAVKRNQKPCPHPPLFARV